MSTNKKINNVIKILKSDTITDDDLNDIFGNDHKDTQTNVIKDFDSLIEAMVQKIEYDEIIKTLKTIVIETKLKTLNDEIKTYIKNKIETGNVDKIIKIIEFHDYLGSIASDILKRPLTQDQYIKLFGKIKK